jgi:hypothetical protein
MELLVPQPKFPFAAKLSPHAQEAETHVREWSRQMRIVPDGPAGDAFDAMLFGRLSGWVYPDAEPDRLLVLAEWMGWVFTFDDLLDDTAEGRDIGFVDQVVECMAAVCRGKAGRGPKAPTRTVARSRDAFADLWQRITAAMPPRWTARLTAHALEYLHSYRPQAAVNSARTVLDESSFTAHRLASVSMYPSMDQIEYATAEPIHASVIAHPDIAALRQAAANVVAWSNDLHSAAKEISVGDLCNYVTVLHHELGVPLQQAADEVLVRIYRQVERFTAVESRIVAMLPRLPAHRRSAVLGLIDGLKFWMTGYVEWSIESGRYRSSNLPDGDELLEATGRRGAA